MRMVDLASEAQEHSTGVAMWPLYTTSSVCLRINSFRRVLLPCHIRPRPLRLAALPVIPWETGAPHGTGPLPLRRRGTAALGLVGSYCHVTSHVWHTFHANQLHGDRPTRKVAQLFTSIQLSSVCVCFHC